MSMLGDIFCDYDGTLSTGRIAFWLVFGLSMYKWSIGIDLPIGMSQVLYALLMYNVFKVPGRTVAQLFSAKAASIHALSKVNNQENEPEDI